MRMRWKTLLTLTCTAWALQTQAAPLQAQDDRGVTVTLAQAPQRIVTMLPSLTEAVCELQACDRLVGTDRYSNWPERVKRLPKAGGLDDAQVEQIVALKPDLVLVSGSARVIPRLEGLGLKVVALETKSHADMRRVLRTVATLIGTPTERADAMWQGVQQRIDAAARRVPTALKGQRVYFEVESSPYAAGPVSFIGETLQRLGLANIVTPELGPFPKLNPEYIVRAQPDIVIASRRNLDAMGGRPGWRTLKALQQGRHCSFDSERYELLIRPGPRLGEAAEMLADCLARLPAAAATAEQR
jgi:iron complex transport system substrate-binding protein